MFLIFRNILLSLLEFKKSLAHYVFSKIKIVEMQSSLQAFSY